MGKAMLAKQRQGLPISSAREQIIQSIKEHRTTIVVGETGSGKTTQIPQYISESGILGASKIAITQPRRVAATSIALRVSEEVGCHLGDEVGYSVRFDTKFGDSTSIKFITDGMLLREAIGDPLLLKYGCIVLDEVHERTSRTDVLLGLLKHMQSVRLSAATGIATKEKLKMGGKEISPNKIKEAGQLKLVIMSATLDAKKFQTFFSSDDYLPPVLYIQGRLHPIKLLYTVDPQPDYFDSALRTVVQIHTEKKKYGDGDILVFLSGQDEIESMKQLLEDVSGALTKEHDSLWPVPLYANLPMQEQSLPFAATPLHTRKVVLATNIAETSVTIPNIRFVVDSGVVKLKTTYSKIGLTSLVVSDVSKAMARQRMGRAGREGPGVCFRLYTEDAFFALKDDLEPELVRTPLSSVILQLKASGVDRIQDFEFIDRPSESGLVQALEELYSIGALDGKGSLTSLGRRMARLPLEPIFSKMILESCRTDRDCVKEVVTIVSMLSVEGNLFRASSRALGFEQQKEATMLIKRLFGNLSEVGVSQTSKSGSSSDNYTPLGDHLAMLNIMQELERVVANFRQKVANNAIPVVINNIGAASEEYSLKSHLTQWCNSHNLNYSSLKQAMLIRSQIVKLLLQMKLASADQFDESYLLASSVGTQSSLADKILQCVFAGLANKLAFLSKDGTYRTTVGQQSVYVHPSSILFNPTSTSKGYKASQGLPKILMYGELVYTSRHYMRIVSAVQSTWLSDSASHIFFA